MSKFKAETSGLKILGWDVENEKSMEELWEKPLFMGEGEKKPGEGEGAELWPSTRTGWYITKAGPQEQEFPHLPPCLQASFLPLPIAHWGSSPLNRETSSQTTDTNTKICICQKHLFLLNKMNLI